MAIMSLAAHFLLCLHTATAYVVNGENRYRHNTSTILPQALQPRAESNAADFGWIRRWAAIGDSFTAGIGSGNLYSQEKSDYDCSRYDLSYPAVIDSMFGSGREKFQFLACSGDRTEQIYNQVKNMDGDQDVVIMTAGGNDLCLADIIKTCIFLSNSNSDSSCQDVIDLAQKNIDSILKPNVREILTALNDKMAKNGLVVYNLYAQFFNTENEDCATKQDWGWISTGLGLTIERRKKYNQLVVNINKALSDVIDEYAKDDKIKYKIRASDWDPWPQKGIDGQFCDPSSTGAYPDKAQPDLQFFKADTQVFEGHTELKRDVDPQEREALDRLAEEASDWSNTVLYKSPNPGAEAIHQLDPRTPSPPGCPSDSKIDWTLGYGLPDRWGKYFHPNELGHQTISAFALATLIEMRAEVLGTSNPVCSKPDEFKCWQKDGRKTYASADQLNKNYKTYCNEVKAPDHTINWEDKRTFAAGTPDEHEFRVSLSDDAGSFDKDQCLESMDRIINSCDGNDDNNPLNWKFGGRYVRGSYTYEVNIKRDNRPWPPIKKTYGDCKGDYKFVLSSYKLHGAGWSTWDYGQNTIIPSMKGCLGLGITKWKFEYFDEPNDDGMEWEATFQTPIFVKARCFANNKVAFNSGGFTDGCSGSDP